MVKSHLVLLSKSNVENKTAKTPQSLLRRPQVSRLLAGVDVQRPDRLVFVFNFSGLPPPSFVEDCFLVTVNNSVNRDRADDEHWIATAVTCVQLDCLFLPETVSPFRTSDASFWFSHKDGMKICCCVGRLV